MKKSLLFLTLCTCTGLVSLPATADSRDRDWPGFELDDQSKRIRFRDLDPTQPAEARALLQRVENAAVRVCQRDHEIRNLQAQRDRIACARESYANAIADINRKQRIDLEAIAAQAPGVAQNR